MKQRIVSLAIFVLLLAATVFVGSPTANAAAAAFAVLLTTVMPAAVQRS